VRGSKAVAIRHASGRRRCAARRPDDNDMMMSTVIQNRTTRQRDSRSRTPC
jgi:hypothetical protein